MANSFSKGFNSQGFNKPKSSSDVSLFHNRDDVDSSEQAHHHTLGLGPSQAAPGSEIKRLDEKIDLLVFLLNARLDLAEERLDEIESYLTAFGSTTINLSSASQGTAVIDLTSFGYVSPPSFIPVTNLGSFNAATTSLSATSATVTVRHINDSVVTQVVTVGWIARGSV